MEEDNSAASSEYSVTRAAGVNTGYDGNGIILSDMHKDERDGGEDLVRTDYEDESEADPVCSGRTPSLLHDKREERQAVDQGHENVAFQAEEDSKAEEGGRERNADISKSVSSASAPQNEPGREHVPAPDMDHVCAEAAPSRPPRMDEHSLPLRALEDRDESDDEANTSISGSKETSSHSLALGKDHRKTASEDSLKAAVDGTHSREVPASKDIGTDATFSVQPGSSARGIVKNVAVLCLSFLLLFTAFSSLQSLQTSLNQEEGVGPGSLAIIYGVMVISSALLPPIVIPKFGCKWTLVFSISGYVIFMAANFHATWWLMAPASAILGLVAPCLWSAKCTYLTELAVCWAKRRSQTELATITRFFGIFFMVFQTSQIWGNLISSNIFKPEDEDEAQSNVTSDVTSCGAAFCPWIPLNQTALVPPERWKVYTLCGVFVACAALSACSVIFLLDPLNRKKSIEPGHGQKSAPKEGAHLLLSTFRHMLRNRKQQLLIPLSAYNGLEQAFLFGDITQSYVGCVLGVWKIGYVLLCVGMVSAATSMLTGQLVRILGNLPIVTVGAFVHTGVLVTLLLWQPDPKAEYVLFVMAGLWGMGDAIFLTNINGLYGALFTKNSEEGFATFRLWQSLGYVVSFTYNRYICTQVKIYFLMATLVLAMVGYYCTEALLRKERREKQGKETAVPEDTDRVAS